MLQFRLDLLKQQPRARAVLEEVAKMANWSQKRAGHGLGGAYVNYLDDSIRDWAQAYYQENYGRLQRIKRKYGKVITQDREIFDQCTDTIVRQVDDIKRMVDEAVNKRLQEHERREAVTERREGAAVPSAT